MSDSDQEGFAKKLHSIFEKNDKILEKRKKFDRGNGVSVRDLEVALTVLLVDLASCDQNFDQQEYNVITHGLMEIFGTSKDEVSALVNQANMVIANMRGTSRFAETLKQNLSSEEKESVLAIIDQIIHVDGEEDGFETYLRAKFVEILGINEAVASGQPIQ